MAASASSSLESIAATAESFDGIPVVDLSKWLSRDSGATAEEVAAECAKAAAALRRYGCLFARDPRVDAADNDRFVC
jgi:hypothetical protein